MSCRGDDAVSVDFADSPEKVVLSVLVDEVADQSEDHKHNNSSAACNVLDDIVFLAPSLADFLQSEENDDGSNANATSWAVPVWETLEDITDDGKDSSWDITETD